MDITKAKGIAVLLEQLRLNMLSEYEIGAVSDICLGLEKQNVKRFGILTADTPFLIVGPVRSGKSNGLLPLLDKDYLSMLKISLERIAESPAWGEESERTNIAARELLDEMSVL